MLNIKCICINDSFRPEDLPISRWIKSGVEYTIIQIDYMNAQNRILGCKLAEINNDDMFPYTYFKLTRFAIKIDSDKELVNERILELENK